MKWVSLVLIAALAYVHFHLWLGKDGWDHHLDLQERLKVQLAVNEDASQRNATLQAELEDLDSGGDAIGELARFELGYIGEGEVFYRIVPKVTLEDPHANIDETTQP